MSIKLNRIYLENFQSIAGPVEIRLADITLLFGPNSAGKSAIFDALELFEKLLSFKTTEEELSQLLKRWTRQESQKEGLKLAFELQCGFYYLDSWIDSRKFENNLFDYEFLNNLVNENYQEDRSKIISSLLPYEEKNNLDDESIISISVSYHFKHFGDSLYLDIFSIHIGNYEFFSYKYLPDEEKFTARLHSEFLKHRPDVTYEYSEFEDVLKDYEGIKLKFERDHIEFSDKDVTANFGSLDYLLWEMNFSNLPWKISNAIRALIRWIGDLYEYTNCLATVSGSRSTPKVEDLTFVSGGNVIANVINDALIKNDSFYELCLNPNYRYKRITNNSDFFFERSHSNAEIIKRVNQFLRDDLFQDVGYQLLLKTYNCAQPNQSAEFVIDQLVLKDSLEREVLIEDVGSGIGYLLPVLITISHRGLAKIQQPELHLHPALQSAVSDVMIEAIEQRMCSQIIVETHSEHIILRLLRRIREYQMRKEAVENPIGHANVSVLYFQPDISTHVTSIKQLRIHPDGTFIDNWPGGFFTERFEDLFNE